VVFLQGVHCSSPHHRGAHPDPQELGWDLLGLAWLGLSSPLLSSPCSLFVPLPICVFVCWCVWPDAGVSPRCQSRGGSDRERQGFRREGAPLVAAHERPGVHPSRKRGQIKRGPHWCPPPPPPPARLNFPPPLYPRRHIGTHW